MTEKDVAVVCGNGWLALQPAPFRDEVLRRAVVQGHAAGTVLYHLGDPPGGIYGLIEGLMRVTAAPGAAMPRLIHVGAPGLWTGEGPYMTGGPRRLTLSLAVESRVMHLPLQAMEQITAQDPKAARHFGQIPLINIDVLLRIVHDLLLRDPDRRIGAVLLRIGADRRPLPIGQAELGDMACATRKQVNYALGRFASVGWVVHGYRSIAVADAAGLRAFVAAEDEG